MDSPVNEVLKLTPSNRQAIANSGTMREASFSNTMPPGVSLQVISSSSVCFSFSAVIEVRDSAGFRT